MTNIAACTGCGRNYVDGGGEGGSEQERLCFEPSRLCCDCRGRVANARIELMDVRQASAMAFARKMGRPYTVLAAIVAGAR